MTGSCVTAPQRSRRSGTAGARASAWWAVANTPRMHNLVVCTLCSCYPWPVLGLPPTWYKSAQYRSRAVRDRALVVGGVRSGLGCRYGDPGVGFDCRSALSSRADASVRHRRVGRGVVGGSRDPRFDDRYRFRRCCCAGMTGEYTSHADLGGRRIEGVIGSEPEGQLWHANWEPRVMAMTLAMGATREWNLDMTRAARRDPFRLRPPKLFTKCGPLHCGRCSPNAIWSPRRKSLQADRFGLHAGWQGNCWLRMFRCAGAWRFY